MIAILGCLFLLLGQPAQQDRKVVSAGELFAAAYFYPQGFVSWKALKGRMANTQEMTKKKAENGAVLYGYQSNEHTVTILVDSLGNVVNMGVFNSRIFQNHHLTTLRPSRYAEEDRGCLVAR